MMALDTFALFFLRLFRRFTKLETFAPSQEGVDATPHATESTDPARLGIVAEIEVDGVATEEYERKNPIFFEPGTPYSPLDGIPTFRGDNLRSGAFYGQSHMSLRRFGEMWSVDTGKLKKGYGKGYWTGSGWTGQPLIVRWSKENRQRMNLREEKKQKDGLVEVIYSTMDGNVYFLDLEDGSATRDVLRVGLPFKGAGALDPRPDTPMLFLGAGDSGPEEGQYARSYIYSLLTCEKLLEFGGQDDFAQRIFHGYDSSHLVHAGTDTLIEPGENGILYTFRLNTTIGPDGDVHIDPSDVAKLRYKSARSSEKSYWLGMEDSAVVWKQYMYIADNGGNLFCIDLNHMKVIWAQDVADDTNGSPVFSVEDGVPYIYIATSLHWKASRRLKLGDVPLFKIHAITGEYVWIRKYFCNTIAGISGGVQATCILGQGDISDLVIFPVARTPQVRSGRLVALDKRTGREVWKTRLQQYAWSSPVAIYSDSGVSTIVQCDSVGNVYLIEGKTGKILDTVNLGSNIEASPAVFEDTIVVGTRGQKIYGIKVK